MLFHVSIEVDDPRRAAEVVAELWDGAALPFPPVTPGSWIAMAGDERGTGVEFYPRGTEIHEVAGDHDATGLRVAPRRNTRPISRWRRSSARTRCSRSSGARAGRPNIASAAVSSA